MLVYFWDHSEFTLTAYFSYLFAGDWHACCCCLVGLVVSMFNCSKYRISVISSAVTFKIPLYHTNLNH